MSYTTLISASQLASLTASNPVLLDCQTSLADLQEGYRLYTQGHLPGAKHADLDIHGASAPGLEGRHPLPDPDALLQQMQRWGIHNDTQVVVYDRANGAFAARFWWCLRWLGHSRVAVLDGGLDQFQGALEIGEDPTREGPIDPARLGSCTRRPALTHTATTGQVLERTAQAQAQANLIDARAQERFDGRSEPIDPIAGHIPGAQCLPFQGNLDTTGCFAPPAVLAERFAGSQAPNAPEPICYCGSGVTAAHNVLAIVHAGLPEPMLYPPSWSGWITDPNRPRAP